MVVVRDGIGGGLLSVGDSGGGGGWADEFAVPIALGENADEAWFAVEDSSDVGWGDAGVAPCGGDCEAHEVGGEVSHAVV